MKKKSCHRVGPRVPLEYGGIQVNFCKNPLCKNLGVPVNTEKKERGPGTKLKNKDTYTLGSKFQCNIVKFKCTLCDAAPPAKSNNEIGDSILIYSFYI